MIDLWFRVPHCPSCPDGRLHDYDVYVEQQAGQLKAFQSTLAQRSREEVEVGGDTFAQRLQMSLVIVFNAPVAGSVSASDERVYGTAGVVNLTDRILPPHLMIAASHLVTAASSTPGDTRMGGGGTVLVADPEVTLILPCPRTGHHFQATYRVTPDEYDLLLHHDLVIRWRVESEESDDTD